MKRFLRYAKTEWERTACVAAAVLLGLFVLDWALTGPRESASSGSGAVDTRQPAFNKGAFAFLAPRPLASELPRDPFRFELSTGAPKARPKRKKPDPPPEVEAEAAADQAEKPKPVQKDQTPPVDTRDTGRNTTPKPTVRPKPRFAACELKFVFHNVNQSGKPVALVELRNPARPGATPLAKTLSAGDTLFGLRILAVTDERLLVADAAGRRHRITLGDQQRVAIRVAGGQ